MLQILKKYFIPNEENDYKPHILREMAVGVIALVAVLVFFAGVFQNLVLYRTDLISAVVSRTLVDLANGERFSNKVAMLSTSPTLVEAAQLKANDMASKSYFAHVSPEGVEPWHWFRETGYNYAYAGENLAINFSESVDVNVAWMNSPLHRKNILDGKFTEIGIATARGVYNGQETVFVVQLFGRPLARAQTTAVGPLPESAAPTEVFSPVAGAAQAGSAETLVLGEEENQVSEEIFISTVNPEVAEEDILVTEPTGNEVESQSNVVDRVVSNPKAVTSLVYLVLGALVLIALLLNIFIEIRRQHLKHILYGVALLLLFVALTFIYKALIFTQVAVI
jgi:uncharacterized protein YkwD